MKSIESNSRDNVSTVWKLATERIITQTLSMPLIDAKTALSTALKGVKGDGAENPFTTWMADNLKKDEDVFTSWFDGIYQIALQEPPGNRAVLCRQLQRLACGQLSRLGHRALSEAHALLNQEESVPWQITSNDLGTNEASNG